jgi:hypothetical protein
MHLLAQAPLRTNPHAVADDQHPDHQLRVDRWSTGLAVIRPKVLADATEPPTLDSLDNIIGRFLPLSGWSAKWS